MKDAASSQGVTLYGVLLNDMDLNEQFLESMDENPQYKSHTAVERLWLDIRRQGDSLASFDDAGVYILMPFEGTVQ